MDDWKPEPNPAVDLKALSLTAEEGFVLSRLDGRTSRGSLTALTGFAPDRVEAILDSLMRHGALVAPAVEASPDQPDEVDADRHEAPDEAAETTGATARQLFETRLHGLTEDARMAGARTAGDPELSAYCFDPLPTVIRSALENPRFGLVHARLVARHHRNPVGLDALGARSGFTADLGVRRWLVRNPQLPVGLLRRLYAGRRMMEQHQLAQDRDVPEQNRRTARELLRARFASGPAEERAELIIKTEGRALSSLTGLPVDGRTASLLCARTYRSTLFVQNIARWSAAPPALIAHLLKQDIVRSQPQLRTMLSRHPNARG